MTNFLHGGKQETYILKCQLHIIVSQCKKTYEKTGRTHTFYNHGKNKIKARSTQNKRSRTTPARYSKYSKHQAEEKN